MANLIKTKMGLSLLDVTYFTFQFNHWLGYVIFSMFVFLVIIVLLNVLNGLVTIL
jgi:hypothetical protein